MRRSAFALVAVFIIAVAASGCGTVLMALDPVRWNPPIFYPKTSIHGVVVDQEGRPVPEVTMTSRHYPPRLVGWPPTIIDHFKTDEHGRWAFSARKVSKLYIEASPPQGYKAALLPDKVRATYVGPFFNGDCPTNDVILRLEKLPSAEKVTI